MSASRSRIFAVLTLLAALAVGAYGVAGYAMAASFAVADPDRLTQHRTAAWVYLALMVVSLVAAIGALHSLWRSGIAR